MARKPSGIVTAMPEDIKVIYNKLVKLISSEREIRPQENILIQQLAIQLYLNGMAVNSILVDGPVLISHTGHGEVQKANPALDVQHKTSSHIFKLSTMLGMEKKAFDAMLDDVEEEEADPVEAMLGKLNAQKV